MRGQSDHTSFTPQVFICLLLIFFLDSLGCSRWCCWWNFLYKLLQSWSRLQQSIKTKNEGWSYGVRNIIPSSPECSLFLLPLCFSTLLDWFWEGEVHAWCQCPRACPLTHCAKRVNAAKSRQRRLWTVKPSMAGTGPCVPSPCHPVREQQKTGTMATDWLWFVLFLSLTPPSAQLVAWVFATLRVLSGGFGLHVGLEVVTARSDRFSLPVTVSYVPGCSGKLLFWIK